MQPLCCGVESRAWSPSIMLSQHHPGQLCFKQNQVEDFLPKNNKQQQSQMHAAHLASSLVPNALACCIWSESSNPRGPGHQAVKPYCKQTAMSAASPGEENRTSPGPGDHCVRQDAFSDQRQALEKLPPRAHRQAWQRGILGLDILRIPVSSWFLQTSARHP
ncbi:hypothetical protein E5288_WYG007685 [Bos mutus]|uniref:Uncharacterized protein n=1 Tax=Bos mutus TaxID=72004 RepID=A0A6B0RDB2_9CETA|nr:hypothetical protein [Bos mutus]